MRRGVLYIIMLVLFIALVSCQKATSTPAVATELASATPLSTQGAPTPLLTATDSPLEAASPPEATASVQIVSTEPTPTATSSPSAAAAVEPTATPTTSPTAEPPPTAAVTDTSSENAGNEAAACTNLASFDRDVTVPDDTLFRQGDTFVKTWRLYNAGTCIWAAGYSFVFAFGDPLGSEISVPMPETPPNHAVDISVDMAAPELPGRYTGNWMIESSSGERFGVGMDGRYPIWVRIEVSYLNQAGEPSSSEPPFVPVPTTEPVAGSNAPACAYLLNPPYEAEVIQQINTIRSTYGLPSLAVNAVINAAARWYSMDMACNNRVDPYRHTDSTGGRWMDRLVMQGYDPSNSFENVWFGNPAYGGTPQAALTWWMNSTIHRDNILNPGIAEIGVGYVYTDSSDYGGYYTVDFVTP